MNEHMSDGSAVALFTLAVTLLVHLISTVWWAASITRRVDYIERWISSHQRTAERLIALEQRIDHLGSGIARIESFLREKS